MKSILIILCCTLTFLSSAQPTEEQIKQVEQAKKEVKKMKGKQFPDFELEAIDGTTYTKEDLIGKILVINFWFTRCRPCIEEMPEMNEMVEEFKDEEIIFLAPTFDSSEQVNKFLSKRNFNYEIVSGVKDFCLELNVRSYPTHFVVNREGTIEKVIIGYNFMSISALRKSVRKLLKS